MAPLAPRVPQPSQMSLGPLNSSARWKQRRPLALEQGVNGSFGCCHCRGASPGDVELEAEIFDFMAKSSKPGSFPTREELFSARRMDLVEAIVDHGGWLVYGWDLDDRSYPSNRDHDNVDAGSDLDGRGKDDEPSNPTSIEPRSGSRRERKRVLSDLQQLESELSSALGSLGMNARKSLDELDRLSDELEFKETEADSVEEKLRSIRAKLSALEGKMTLRTAEAAKILREKQRRIDAARRALGVLSAVNVIWPGSASEVFLAGSFDGWATLREMEKSSGGGVFSLYLKLYPRQYEIKFVVDGVWRVDPLRPIVVHSAFENNLLVVH